MSRCECARMLVLRRATRSELRRMPQPRDQEQRGTRPRQLHKHFSSAEPQISFAEGNHEGPALSVLCPHCLMTVKSRGNAGHLHSSRRVRSSTKIGADPNLGFLRYIKGPILHKQRVLHPPKGSSEPRH